jgi:hypothetical protein
MERMDNAQDASAAAAALARARWGTRKLDQAVDVVVSRSAELSQAQRAELQAVVTGQDGDDAA